MAQVSGRKKRIPIKVSLFNKNGEVIANYQRTVISRILDDVQVGSNNKAFFSGTCRVTYTPGYWNEFNFTNFNEFRRSLIIDTEKDLILEFSNVS